MSLQNTTKSIHAETVGAVEGQMKDLDVQMRDLDDFVGRARSQNTKSLAEHARSMAKLSSTTDTSFASISNHFQKAVDRAQEFGNEMDEGVAKLRGELEPLSSDLCQPLGDLRHDVAATKLHEYEPTGHTPDKTQYQYPTDLPKTEAHQVLIAGMADAPTPSKSAPVIFSDPDALDETNQCQGLTSPVFGAAKNPLGMSLREVNPNLAAGSLVFDPSCSTMSLQPDHTLPMFRRSARGSKRLPKVRSVMVMEGRENMPPAGFSQSTSRRKSPRLH